MDFEDYDEVFHDLIQGIQEGQEEIVKSCLLTPIEPNANLIQSGNCYEKNNRYYISANATDNDGCYLLQWAAINNRFGIAKLLLLHQANVNAIGGFLQANALQWALRKQNYAMMHLLFQHGASLEHKNKNGIDCVHIACQNGDLNALLMLLEWKADPNSLDANGLTPILWLVTNKLTEKKTLDLIRILLRYNADVTLVEPTTQNTALHIICKHQDVFSNYSESILLFEIANKGGVALVHMKNNSNQMAYNVSMILIYLYIIFISYTIP